ncbi:DUF4352 domain-containing protein [Rummeliibacillus pycnus]|uniref:DUF4352 domain-containing protein n=1 Tax=Rummeliibacillus pycnus TaxID=101070 RepID=UPI000C9CB17D|nr:DUF4352 domain-containing protein [Rummeliibacillus pycnus]
MNKILKLIIVSAFLMAILTACGEAEVKQVDQSTKTTEKKVKKAPTFYKVGDTVSIDGMEIKLVSAKFVKPAEYVKTEKGKVLEIEVSAKNNSANNGFVDNTEFTISDAKGNMQEQYFGFDYTLSGEVKKGKTMTGKIAFDVPYSKEYELYYEPSFSLKNNAEIKFKLKKSELK